MTSPLAVFMMCLALAAPAHAAGIPVVGCPGDVQTGQEPPPANTSRRLPLDGEHAAALAWYFHGSMGVLAPRGWHCRALSGSNGTSLYVAPRQADTVNLLRPDSRGIPGPAVQLSVAAGSTSGRFTAARRIARLFPHERKFVDDVIAEGIEPASAFPSGPYPRDQMVRRGPNAIRYQTPADADGLGYDSWLARGDRPITGVVILMDSDRSVLSLAVRLPRELRNLGDVIAGQVEADNPPLPLAGEADVVMGRAAATRFVYASKPVHPFCVDFPADSARWNPLAFSDCTRAEIAPVVETGGWRSADHPREGNFPGGYISYRVLASKGNRILVATAGSGGGSGIHSTLRWYSVEEGRIFISKEEMGGDRCAGGLSGFEVKDGLIEFGRDMPATTVIGLSGAGIDPRSRALLNGSPVDCDGTARYRYDPATERMQMISLTLNPPPSESEAGRRDTQSCFDGLARRFTKPLSPDDLEGIGRAFASGCAAGSAKP